MDRCNQLLNRPPPTWRGVTINSFVFQLWSQGTKLRHYCDDYVTLPKVFPCSSCFANVMHFLAEVDTAMGVCGLYRVASRGCSDNNGLRSWNLVECHIFLSGLIINPRRACARGVITVLGLCVCVYVTTLAAASFIFTLELKCEQVYHGILFIFNWWILIKMLRSEVMASFAYHDSLRRYCSDP